MPARREKNGIRTKQNREQSEEKKVNIRFFFLIQKLSQIFALCACLKPKVDFFDPTRKASSVSCGKQHFVQSASNLPQ